MNMRFYVGFTIPMECSVCEIYMNAKFKQFFPQVCNLFTLTYRVCGNKGHSDFGIICHITCFFIPAADIVKISGIRPIFAKHIK